MDNQESRRLKKNKHKKSKPQSQQQQQTPPPPPPPPPPPQEDENSNDLLIADELSVLMNKNKSPNNKSSTNNANKRKKKRDSASSDEERWLTAIESGKLEDVDDELKKIKPKDPALMTARQRAIYDRGIDGPSPTTPTLMSLPTGYKEKVMTAEALQKAAIKSQKRKQLADEKREKDKKRTMERLLKKQDSKIGKSLKSKTTKTNVPMITYKQNIDITALSFPIGMQWPLNSNIRNPPKRILCEMGCGNVKKYNCSRTNVPLCSLQCYKKNINNRVL